MDGDAFEISSLMDQFLRRLHGDMKRAVAAAELSIAREDARVLMLIQKRPGISIGEVAVFADRDKSQVTRKIQELEGKGYLRRAPDAHDQRVSTLTLTQTGAHIADTVRRAMQEVLAHMTEALSDDERAQFSRLLAAIVSAPNAD